MTTAEYEPVYERFVTRTEIVQLAQGTVSLDMQHWFDWLVQQENYAVGFVLYAERVMPDDPEWRTEAKPVVDLVIAMPEPVTEVMPADTPENAPE